MSSSVLIPSIISNRRAAGLDTHDYDNRPALTHLQEPLSTRFRSLPNFIPCPSDTCRLSVDGWRNGYDQWVAYSDPKIPETVRSQSSVCPDKRYPKLFSRAFPTPIQIDGFYVCSRQRVCFTAKWITPVAKREVNHWRQATGLYWLFSPSSPNAHWNPLLCPIKRRN